MTNESMERVIKFVACCRYKGFDLDCFLKLMLVWEKLTKEEKAKVLFCFKVNNQDFPELFKNVYDEVKDYIKFDVSVFRSLYVQWASLTAFERTTSYGMFYKNGNRRYTGKRYKNSEKNLFQFEIFNEDIDARNENSRPSGMYKYRCRDCSLNFYKEYNTLFCPSCGSINIYSPYRDLVYKIRDWDKMPEFVPPKRLE